MTTKEIISQIIEGNNNFTKLHQEEYYESFKSEQRPCITLVTCSDSRVTLNTLMDDTSNKIFSIQNIGNQLMSNEGSVDYGICHLKTSLLIFLGHSDCGAIKACLRGIDDESPGIRHELGFLNPLLAESKSETDFTKLHAMMIEKNLDYQVDMACNKYRDQINSRKLTVIAGFYDFRGDYGKGPGTIVIVNVNGQNTIDELYDLPLFADLSDDQKKMHIGRQGERT